MDRNYKNDFDYDSEIVKQLDDIKKTTELLKLYFRKLEDKIQWEPIRKNLKLKNNKLATIALKKIELLNK